MICSHLGGQFGKNIATIEKEVKTATEDVPEKDDKVIEKAGHDIEKRVASRVVVAARMTKEEMFAAMRQSTVF